MTAITKIEWADSTFNPWQGCTKISAACDHCYAEARMDTRLKRVEWGAGKARVRTSPGYWRHPLQWNAKPFRQCKECGWRGDDKARGHMPFDTESDTAPIKGCPSCGSYDFADARRRVFCASLADVFDNEADPQWRADLFELIARTPHLDWLLLTKRIGNAREMMDVACTPLRMMGAAWPLPNIWLGATLCNQAEADRDIPKLLATPAARRFLSIEPMLGPVDLVPMFEHRADAHNDTGVDWIICGGESGSHARPMHPDWARSLRDQCAAAGVPFMHKQNGEWVSVSEVAGPGAHHHFPDGATVRRVGKHAAGRLLDGVEHNGVPA